MLIEKALKVIALSRLFCGPSWARTNDPLIMSQMLWPTELWDQSFFTRRGKSSTNIWIVQIFLGKIIDGSSGSSGSGENYGSDGSSGRCNKKLWQSVGIKKLPAGMGQFCMEWKGINIRIL